MPWDRFGEFTSNHDDDPCFRFKESSVEPDRMLKWFAYSHLPVHLQDTSADFFNLAQWICSNIEPGPERTVALRKLLEAKDAAVRAKLNPGG